MPRVQCPPEENLYQKTEECKKAEAVCKEVCLRYSLPVLFGNWYDAQCETTVRSNKIEEKQKLGETFNQRKEAVLLYLVKPLLLAKYTDFLYYNVPVKLVSNHYIFLRDSDTPISHLVLASIITEKQIDANKLQLHEGCNVTISELTKSMRRNTFCLVPLSSGKSESQVSYNENLYICLYDSGSSTKLYLRCEVPTVDAFGMGKERFNLNLTETPDRYCIFKLLSWLTTKRRSTLGKSVPSNKTVLICHSMSNRCLAIEQDSFFQSSLFDKERYASCFNYQDIYRQPTSENFWIIATRLHGEEARQMDAEREEAEKKAREEEMARIKMEKRKAERDALLAEVACIKNPVMNFIFIP